MKQSFKLMFSTVLMVIAPAAFALCDVTLPRAQHITCMSLEQQQQTGVIPHQSYFAPPVMQAPQPVYQQPAPVYQAPTYQYQAQPPAVYQQQAPAYQQPPVQWVPTPSRRSTYQ